jgi:hypothetical protein
VCGNVKKSTVSVNVWQPKTDAKSSADDELANVNVLPHKDFIKKEGREKFSALFLYPNISAQEKKARHPQKNFST